MFEIDVFQKKIRSQPCGQTSAFKARYPGPGARLRAILQNVSNMAHCEAQRKKAPEEYTHSISDFWGLFLTKTCHGSTPEGLYSLTAAILVPVCFSNLSPNHNPLSLPLCTIIVCTFVLLHQLGAWEESVGLSSRYVFRAQRIQVLHDPKFTSAMMFIPLFLIEHVKFVLSNKTPHHSSWAFMSAKRSHVSKTLF